MRSRYQRLLLVLTGMLMAMCLISGCGSTTSKPTTKGDLQEITLGVMPDTDSIPFIIAEQQGYFEQEGLKVNIQHFKSAMDRDSALQSGNLDGAVSDMLAVGFARDGGFDVRVTSMTDGSYKLIAGKTTTAQTAAELAGQDVAVSRNTIIEYVTDQIFAHDGLTGDSINKVIIPKIPTRLEMLQNGKLAAATLPEPMASIAVHNGCRFITGSDELGINPGVIMFTQAATTDKKAEIQALYRAYNKAVDYLNTTERSQYIDAVIEASGFPAEAKEALRLPQYSRAILPKESDVNDCLNWLTQKGLIHGQYSYGDIVLDLLTQ